MSGERKPSLYEHYKWGPRYEQFKWTVLDHTDNHNLGMPYYLARELFPEATDAEIEKLVRKAMLELLDEGLIAFYYTAWDDAFSVAFEDIEPVDRADVVAELDEGGEHVERRHKMLFYLATPKGEEVLAVLPHNAVWRGGY